MTSLVSRGTRPTLALVGATGAVGSVTQQVLGMRADIWGEVRAAAAPEDVGSQIVVCGRELVVQALTAEFFDGVDIALVDLPPEVAAACSCASAAGASARWASWKAASRSSWDCFSASVARASSTTGGCASVASATKVLTPMMGSEPSCFLCS